MSQDGVPRMGLTLMAGPQVGDIWRVESVATDEREELRFVVFERVQAEPGQYRKRGDGLYPPLPDTRPLSPEEVTRLNAEMDAAMAEGQRLLEAEAFRLPPGDG